jgi:hypothetical protein
MKYYMMNTDTKTIGRSPHPEWVEKGYAFTEGNINYGNKFKILNIGDLLFAYASKVGIVAVGEVEELWDGKTYNGIIDVYPNPNSNVYKIKVEWSKILAQPISSVEIRNLGGAVVPQTLYKINSDVGNSLLSLRRVAIAMGSNK